MDVYAFGVLLWEILARQIPFYMVDLYDLYDRVRAGDRPRIASAACSRQCSQLITAAWSQRSEDRPTFTEIVDQLLEIYDQTVDSKHTAVSKQPINWLSFRGAMLCVCVQSVGGDALDSIMGK